MVDERKQEAQKAQVGQIAQKIIMSNIPTVLVHQVHLADSIISSRPDAKGEVIKQGQVLMNFTDGVTGNVIARFALNSLSAKDLIKSLGKTVERLETELASKKPLVRNKPMEKDSENKMIS